MAENNPNKSAGKRLVTATATRHRGGDSPTQIFEASDDALNLADQKFGGYLQSFSPALTGHPKAGEAI